MRGTGNFLHRRFREQLSLSQWHINDWTIVCHFIFLSIPTCFFPIINPISMECSAIVVVFIISRLHHYHRWWANQRKNKCPNKLKNPKQIESRKKLKRMSVLKWRENKFSDLNESFFCFRMTSLIVPNLGFWKSLNFFTFICFIWNNFNEIRKKERQKCLKSACEFLSSQNWINDVNFNYFYFEFPHFLFCFAVEFLYWRWTNSYTVYNPVHVKGKKSTSHQQTKQMVLIKSLWISYLRLFYLFDVFFFFHFIRFFFTSLICVMFEYFVIRTSILKSSKSNSENHVFLSIKFDFVIFSSHTDGFGWIISINW